MTDTSTVPLSSEEKRDSTKMIKCQLCNVWCSGNIAYQSHIQGRPHFAKLMKPAGGESENGKATDESKKGKKRTSSEVFEELCCELCNISCLGEEQFQSHLRGIRHVKRLKSGGEEKLDLSTMPFIKVDAGWYECTICDVKMNGISSIVSHTKGLKHLKKSSADTSKESSTPSKETVAPPPWKEITECKICRVPINSAFQQEEHERSVKHQHKAAVFAKRAEKEADLGKDYDAWDPKA